MTGVPLSSTLNSMRLVVSPCATAGRQKNTPLVALSVAPAGKLSRPNVNACGGRSGSLAELVKKRICPAFRTELETEANVGAWFTGRNELPERTWETRSEVVAADPGREFAFAVHGTIARWGYTFAAVDGGTEITESWEFLPRGIEFFEERFGDDSAAQIADRVEKAHTGIAETLAAIKRIAEAG